MRPLEAVFEDSTALFAQSATLMRRARALRQELEAAQAVGADDAERRTHEAIAGAIVTGLGQGLEAALRPAQGSAESHRRGPAWLPRLLEC